MSSPLNFTQYAALPHGIEIVMWPRITVTSLHGVCWLRAGGESAAVVQDTAGQLRFDERCAQRQDEIRAVRSHGAARQLPG